MSREHYVPVPFPTPPPTHWGQLKFEKLFYELFSLEPYLQRYPIKYPNLPFKKRFWVGIIFWPCIGVLPNTFSTFLNLEVWHWWLFWEKSRKAIFESLFFTELTYTCSCSYPPLRFCSPWAGPETGGDRRFPWK